MGSAATTSGAAVPAPPSARLRLLLPVLAAAALAAAVLHFGMIHFGGFDGSALLQGAWRYHQGQAPYTEIVAPGVPPSYLVFPGLAFGLFGVSWHSLVLLTALYAAGTFLVQHVLLRRLGFGLAPALGLAFAVQAVSLLPLSWWHYNQATSVAGALFVTASVLFIRERGLASSLLFIACTVLLSWMKVNVAGFLLAGVGVVMLCRCGERRRYLACLAAAVALSVAAMLAARVSPAALVRALLEASGRVGHLGMLRMCLWSVDMGEAAATLAVLAVVMAACCVYAWHCRRKICCNWRPAPDFAVVLLAIAAGFIGMATNLDHNMADAPCVITGCGILLCAWRPSSDHVSSRGFARAAVVGIGLLAAIGLGFTVFRSRVASIGPGMFYEEGETVMLSQPPLFDGLRAGPRLALELRDMQALLDALPPGIRQKGLVFFGPRMEFGYPAFGVTPPPGMPVWWMGTGEGRPETVHAVVETFRRWNPVCGIFLRGDATYMPPELIDHLNRNYLIVDGRDMTFLWLKTEPLPAFLSVTNSGGGQ